jgi:hypothetical protein
METKLLQWIQFIQQPQSIGTFPICPYAAKAMLENKVEIQELFDINTVESVIESIDLSEKDVTILYFVEYLDYDVEYLQNYIIQLNAQFNIKDKVVLENDPRVPFIINDVTTTFPDCYLILIQGLQHLNEKSKLLQSTGYYNYWTRQQLNEVVTWRTQ